MGIGGAGKEYPYKPWQVIDKDTGTTGVRQIEVIYHAVPSISGGRYGTGGRGWLSQ